MKPLKSLVLSSALLAGLAGSAFASTQVVYIVGAPAFRQDTNTNIAAYVATFSGAGLTATSGPTTGTTDVINASQNQWLIPNFPSTGQPLEINVSLTGSTAGFESVASGVVTQKFIPDGTGSIASPLAAQTNTQAAQPSFTLSDTFQATTPFNKTVTLKGPTNTTSFTHTYAALTANPLGIEPYQFVASPGAAAAGLTNITSAQAANLFANGVLPLAFFTGKSTDEGTLVYGLTRDGGSGSRLVAQTEIGLGLKTTLTTYKPTITGGSLDTQGNQVKGVDSIDAFDAVPVYPAGLISSTGVWDNTPGDTGYAKFGTSSGQNGLLLAITSTPPAGALFVTYFNTSDGAEAAANGAEDLTYNGVAYGPTTVAEGQYTFWSYEQLFAPSSLAGAAATVASALEASWVPTISINNVNVSRSVDGELGGSTLTQNYSNP